MSEFFEALANARPDPDRVERLAGRIDKAAVGFNTGETLMALSFMIHRILHTIPDRANRDSVLSGVIVMIDPPKGTA